MKRAATNITRWQFSIRATLIGVTLLGICMAIAVMYVRRASEQSFLRSTVVPITENYVSSVGYANGRIVWLRVNNFDAHHPNHFDEWVVPIPMDVASNDGSIGKYRTFGDRELTTFVTNHPYLRALDVRNSGVTSAGLSQLGKLKQLAWLWLDSKQATETGLSSLHQLSSLRIVWLPLDEIDSDLADQLRRALPTCKFEDSSRQVDFPPPGPEMP